MYIINARNVNDAVCQAIPYLIEHGEREKSRNGMVLVAPGPVVTVYEKPMERVLFSNTRDANPFFHLMESLWMLAGRDDVGFPTLFNKRFSEYSDDGKIVHGAYGHRWRKHFGYDQLKVIIKELKANPATRRCVLQMWDATELDDFGGADDLHLAMNGGKDVPCNTQAYFDLRHGVLNMTVLCRSNDIIWGAYGANAVHFSILQEYMAACLKVNVGVYRQFSNNFHAYTDIYDIEKMRVIAHESNVGDPYELNKTRPSFLVDRSVEDWDADLSEFMEDPLGVAIFREPFFNNVAQPMYAAWKERKDKRGDGMEHVLKIQADDWRMACIQWIIRREGKH